MIHYWKKTPTSNCRDGCYLSGLYIYISKRKNFKKGELQIKRGVEIETVRVGCYVSISAAAPITL